MRAGGRGKSARTSWDVVERSEHDMSIHKAVLRMSKRPGQRADNLESELLPKPHCRRVGGYYEIELHGSEPQPSSLDETMLAHAFTNSESPSRRGDHEGSVGDMVAKRRLVGLENVSANNLRVSLGDVGMGIRAKPISESVLSGYLRIKSVGVARSDDGVEDVPNGGIIEACCETYSNPAGDCPHGVLGIKI